MIKLLETSVEKVIERRSPSGRLRYSKPSITTTSHKHKSSLGVINLARPKNFDKKSNSDLSVCPSVELDEFDD